MSNKTITLTVSGKFLEFWYNRCLSPENRDLTIDIDNIISFEPYIGDTTIIKYKEKAGYAVEKMEVFSKYDTVENLVTESDEEIKRMIESKV